MEGEDVEMLVGIGLTVVIVVGMVAFVVSEWRRSEREQRRWQSRRGVGEKRTGDGDRGAYRSHWRGMGRPGGRGR